LATLLIRLQATVDKNTLSLPENGFGFWLLMGATKEPGKQKTTTSIMEVLVFKTNLTSIRCINNAGAYLTAHPHILRWNVDLYDCDNILRIETEQLNGADIQDILAQAGHDCEELL